jgi:hypothetical protein
VSHHQQTTVRLKFGASHQGCILSPRPICGCKGTCCRRHAPAGFLRGSNRFLGRTLSHRRDPAPAAGFSRCGECDVSHRRCLPGVAQEGPSRGIITLLLSPGEVQEGLNSRACTRTLAPKGYAIRHISPPS